METLHPSELIQPCSFTSKLFEAIESPVENARKIHQQKLMKSMHDLEREMEMTSFKVRLSEAAIQRRIIFKLKTEIIHKLDSLHMPEERKSYLLHQLANARDIDELSALIHESNHRQISQEAVILSDAPDLLENVQSQKQDLLFISLTPQGISLVQKQFNLTAGVFADGMDTEKLYSLKQLAKELDFQLLNHELTINETLHSALNTPNSRHLSDSTVALIGTTGNIMKLCADMMASKVQKLILLHHSPLDSSLKFQRMVYRIIQKILSSPDDSRVSRVIKAHWSTDIHVVNFLDLPEVQEVLVATSDLRTITEADTVICGNCPTTGFLSLDYFKSNTRIIDMSSSRIFDPEMIAALKTTRSDLSYHLIFKQKEIVLN